jgi:molybdopterin converting factor small subunit
MKIQVYFFGSLRDKYNPDNKPIILSMKENTTVKDVLSNLGITENNIIAIINNFPKSLQTDLKDGDKLGLYPFPTGG